MIDRAHQRLNLARHRGFRQPQIGMQRTDPLG